MKHSCVLFYSILFIFLSILTVTFATFMLFEEIGQFEHDAWKDLETFQKYSEDAWQLIANSTREKRAVYRFKLPPRNDNRPRYVTIPPQGHYAVPELGGMPPPVECPQGSPGRPGRPGYPGEDGSAGQPGSPGGSGPSLSIKLPYNGCIKCPMGPMGEAGRPGLMGYPGEEGSQGIDGIPGARGLPGMLGYPGDSGMDGSKGHDGATGQPGRSGTRSFGSPGHAGSPGRSGPVGPPGFDGGYPVPGAPGTPGPAGKTGQPGGSGVDGHPGSAGGTGRPGPDSGYCQCPHRGKTDEFSNYPPKKTATVHTSTPSSTDWRRKLRRQRVNA